MRGRPAKRPIIHWFFKRWAATKKILLWTTYLLCGSLFIGVVVFWNADFYLIRDRWEHFKLAVFSEWKNDCPAGFNFDECQQYLKFKTAFSLVDDFHFFKSMPVEGTDFVIGTGARFDNAEAVLQQNSSHQWCYIEFLSRGLTTKVSLAEKRDTPAIVVESLSNTNISELSGKKLSKDRLLDLAKSHCQFDFFKNEGSTDVI